MSGLLDLPDDVLWMILRQYLHLTFGNRRVYEYIRGIYGYPISRYDDGRGDTNASTFHYTVTSTIIDTASIHPKIDRCLRKRCIWHKVKRGLGWDFKFGSYLQPSDRNYADSRERQREAEAESESE
jgi:hypothetical protein